MIYHEIDLFILKEIYNSYLKKQNAYTGIIARKWNWGDKPKKFITNQKEEDYWRKKYDFIGKRLKVMEKEGLIFIFKNDSGKNEYTLIKDNVILKKTKFPDKKYGKSIWIKEKDRRWQSFQI